MDSEISKTEKNLYFPGGKGYWDIIFSLNLSLYFRTHIEGSYLSSCFKHFDLLQSLLNSDKDGIFPGMYYLLGWDAVQL